MNPNRTITLKSGMTLAFADYGDVDGKPLLYFHGLPGSRLEASPHHHMAKEAGIHLIAIDRPGIGLSTYQPNRTIMDWPATVREFAETLDIDKFNLIAYSGGAPYALACAAAIPELLDKIVICCGVPSHDWYRKIESPRGVARHIRKILSLPHAIRSKTLHIMKWYFLITGGKVNRSMALRLFSPPDAETVLDEKHSEEISMNIRESMRGSVKGTDKEIELLINPWGFDPRKITVPISVWYAGNDWLIPSEIMEELIGKLPGVKKHYYKDEGHFSLRLKHFGKIIEELGREV